MIVMGTVCEHEFEQEDPRNEGYSMTEYDLYARLGLTIRKNLRKDIYEIVGIKDKEVRYSSLDLKTIVRIANKLESVKNTEIKCGVGSTEKK